MKRIAGFLFAAALAASGSARADDDCHLQRLAALDFTYTASGDILIPVSIGGQQKHFIVETGSPSSAISRKSAIDLGLTPEVGRQSLEFINGVISNSSVKLHDFSLGKLHANEVFVAVVPDSIGMGGADGILGQDFLNRMDSEFDFANGKLNLFDPRHCDGIEAYWASGGAVAIPFTWGELSGSITLPVELDGKSLKAVINTGSSRSLLSLERAEETLGLDPKDPSLTQQGTHAGSLGYHYPFKTLSFQGAEVHRPDIMLLSNDKMGREMIVGMDILRQLHIYISVRKKELFVTPASEH